MTILRHLLFVLIVCPIISFSQTIKFRQYKKGDAFRYKLSTEVYRNEKFASKSILISSHLVVQEKNHLAELVEFTHKVNYSSSTDSIVLDSIARRLPPYVISLSPKGKVLLPALKIPELTGDITDLNTFYVAVAPALDIQLLSNKKPILQLDKLRQGNFADSTEILYGTDCLKVIQRLVSSSKDYSIVETSFLAPDSLCLKPLIDEIGARSGNQFSNIQFIRRADNNQVNLFWGIESFIITSKISNRTGQVMEAKMINLLELKMRYNSSKDLKSFAAEFPVTIRRVLKLELLK